MAAIHGGQFGSGELRSWLRAQTMTAHSEALQADQRGDETVQEERFALARATGTAFHALDADPNSASQGAAYESLFLGPDGDAENLIATELANNS